MEHYAVIKNYVLESYLSLLEIARRVQHTVKRFFKKMKESSFHYAFCDAMLRREVGKWNPGKLTGTRWYCVLPESTAGAMGGYLGVSLDTPPTPCFLLIHFRLLNSQ